MSPEDVEKLEEINRLLEEAYDHYFQYESHCKSSEGFVSLEYGTLWDRREHGLKITNVHIYSYVFCREGRSQDFDTLDEALETVREWHRDEMSYDYNAPSEVKAREELDAYAAEMIETLANQGRLRVVTIDEKSNSEDER